MECIEPTSLRMHHLINTSLPTEYVAPPRMRYYCLTTTVTNFTDQNYSYSPRCLPLFLDFSLAFNTIDARLLQPGQKPLDSNVINLVASFLTCRTQRTIVINNNMSKSIATYSGTPQGSVLCALLFSIHTNPIVQSLNAVTSPYSNRQTVPVK